MTSLSPLREPARSNRFIRVLIALILATSFIPLGIFTNTKEAHGAEILAIGDTYHGSCYIEDTWWVGPISYFNVSAFSGELSGCWATGLWQCADPTALAPEYVGATYEASVSAVNVEEGWVEYYVYITPPNATNGIDRNPYGYLYGYQHVDGHVRVAKDFGGFIELSKTSANQGITQDNACYSLAGAVYKVMNESGEHVATLTTDASGYAKTTTRLPFGRYNVVEDTPPEGYALDRSDNWVEITAANNATVRVSASDKPQGNPVSVMVAKIDADTASNLLQGDASLKGAEFTITYYDGYYANEADAVESGDPTRTWILRTDEDGQAYLQQNYLVAGSDELYTNSSGETVVPLGTVVIKETKAPADYVLPDPAAVSVQQVTSNNQLENLTSYNVPKIADTVKRGDISLTKAYDDSPEKDTGTMVPEEGITFDFYASHQFDGSNPKEGVDPAFSLTTDEKGRASTESLYIIENADGSYSERPRKTSDVGGLPHDTYLMVQRNSPEGFEKLEPLAIYVSENAKTYDYLLQNGAVFTPLQVVKIDSETGKVVPYPASWQIISMDTGNPVSMTTHYPTTETFDVFTSDAQGRLTLPEKLPWGDYKLKEVLAPAEGATGYLLNPQNIKFTTAEGYDWDNPLTITFADAPAKGLIEIRKTDEVSGEAVKSASYVIQATEDIYTLDGTLRASSGEIVDTITTDDSGYAASKPLYLGHYDVIEAISPEGFALDTAHYPVSLEYEDQSVAIVTEGLEVKDAPTTLRIAKTDLLSGEAMAGVSFTVTGITNGYEETVVTDEEGIAELGYLPHGDYSVSEVTTPFGYVSNEESYSFSVDDQGLIEGKSLYTLSLSNTPIQVEISKIDIATSGELPGCGLEIYKVDDEGNISEEPMHAWESTGVPYPIVGGLEPGDYILRETYPAPGYVSAEEVKFSVEDSGEVQKVLMEDDFTKLEISKRDIVSEEELPGAHLKIYEIDKEGNKTSEPLYEWVSTDKPYYIEYIEVGDYVLSEEVAPVGYELAQEIKFSITESGEVQRVVMHDKATPDVPEKGKGYDKTGVDMVPLAILAALLFAGGLLGLGIGIKRHHKERLELREESETSEEINETE